MQTIIGSPIKTPGSLVNQGISYHEIPMIANHPNIDAIVAAITDKTRMVHVQRSCGYSSVRKTLTVDEIGEIFSAVKRVKPDIICFVDNCYGEFIEDKEPTQVGADLMAGSLIKNLGGGIAPTGGYIVGRKDLVELASYRLTAPGLGGEMGATLGDTAREFYEGLFFAPHQDFDFCGFRIPESRIRSVSATRRTPQRYHPNDYPKNQGKSLPLL